MRGQKGYTIIEVLVFLGISSGLVLLALVGVSQRQGNTQFSTEMREIEARIRGVFSDAQSGYFDNFEGYTCSNNGGSVEITAGGTDRLGENDECVYLGKAIAFGDSVNEADRGSFRIYTIVGLRPGTGALLSNAVAADVAPTAIADADIPGITPEESMSWGIRVMNRSNARYTNIIGAINGLSATNQQISTFVVPGNPPVFGDGAQRAALSDSSNYALSDSFGPAIQEHIICFEEQGDDRRAQITIARNGQQLTTELEFKDCDV